MQALFRQAGVSDVVVHCVDLGGLEGPIDVSTPTGAGLGRAQGVGALSALAENTGGRLIRGSNDFARALREIDDVSRHYYVLAFQPTEPAPKPGRPRSVKVRVHGDRLRVSHRAAYIVPLPTPAADEASLRREAAEAIGKGITGGPLGLQLVAVPYRDGQGKASLPAVLHVDGRPLAAAVRGDRLAIHVYGYALSTDRVLDTLDREITLDLPTAAAASLQGEGLRVLTTFAV